MMIGNLEGFIIEPSGQNLTLFRRASEPRHAYEVEITARRVTVHQFHPVDVAHGDAFADARRYVPALRKAARQFQRQAFANPSRSRARPVRVGHEASAIREDLRNAFEKLIQDFEVRERAADQERARVARARKDFEDKFKRAADQIIVPALDGIANLLRQSGWTCRTTPLPSGMGVSFAICRGAMKASEGAGAPHIAFSGISDRRTLRITSFGQSGGGGCHEYALDEVSNDFVAHQVLLFFQRLASEYPAALC